MAESLLFDNWFDAIEDGVRARVRGFIETLLDEELAGALSRPRYGRRTSSEDGEPPPVVGVRHGDRKRRLTGTFGRTKISVPRARLMGAGGEPDATLLAPIIEAQVLFEEAGLRDTGRCRRDQENGQVDEVLHSSLS